jgi:hypothetical protein
LTVGFKHARLLRDVIAETADNPRALVEEFYRTTEAQIAPWHHAQIASTACVSPRPKRSEKVGFLRRRRTP